MERLGLAHLIIFCKIRTRTDAWRTSIEALRLSDERMSNGKVRTRTRTFRQIDLAHKSTRKAMISCSRNLHRSTGGR
jgi:hypothetical protein